MEFQRGKARSLKTKDKTKALRAFKEIEREVLGGRLLKLETCQTISFNDVKNIKDNQWIVTLRHSKN